MTGCSATELLTKRQQQFSIKYSSPHVFNDGELIGAVAAFRGFNPY